MPATQLRSSANPEPVGFCKLRCKAPSMSCADFPGVAHSLSRAISPQWVLQKRAAGFARKVSRVKSSRMARHAYLLQAGFLRSFRSKLPKPVGFRCLAPSLQSQLARTRSRRSDFLRPKGPLPCNNTTPSGTRPCRSRVSAWFDAEQLRKQIEFDTF